MYISSYHIYLDLIFLCAWWWSSW